jgi:hypothetical protein
VEPLLEEVVSEINYLEQVRSSLSQLENYQQQRRFRGIRRDTRRINSTEVSRKQLPAQSGE